MSTITNNKLTDEHPDDEGLELLITIRREIAERHASEGRMEQCAVHTLILNALLELQERRKADSEPAGYHVIKECGKVGCSVATLEEAEKTRDFWNKRWAIRPYFYTPPALVATGATYSGFEDFWSACKHPFAQDDELKDVSWVIWNACRDAMLQSKYRDLSQPVDPQISEYEKIMLQSGNSPVIPDGYALVPVEPTDEMIAAAMNCEDVLFNSDESFCVQFGNIYEAMLAAAPQQEVK